MNKFKRRKKIKKIVMIFIILLLSLVSALVSIHTFAWDPKEKKYDIYISIDEDPTVDKPDSEKPIYIRKKDSNHIPKVHMHLYGLGSTKAQFPKGYLWGRFSGQTTWTKMASFDEADDDLQRYLNNIPCLELEEVGKYIFKAEWEQTRAQDSNQPDDDEEGDVVLEATRGEYTVYIFDCGADNVDVVYDGNEHYIEAKMGAYGSEVYYSTKNPNEPGFNDWISTETNPGGDWSAEPIAYSEPGAYNTYYKVVCNSFPVYDKTEKPTDPTYSEVKSFIGSAMLRISGKEEKDPRYISENTYRKTVSQGASGLLAPYDYSVISNQNIYDKVYLGTYANGSASSGIKFRILDTATNDNFYKAGFLLQAANNLGASGFGLPSTKDEVRNKEENNFETEWYLKSTVRTAMDLIYKSAFTALEKSKIIKTTKTEETERLYGYQAYQNSAPQSQEVYALGSTINDLYLFPLSIHESFSDKYGFSLSYDGYDTDLGTESDFISYDGQRIDSWWTRSTMYIRTVESSTGVLLSSELSPGYASSSVTIRARTDIRGLRPALNFDVSDVILTSAAGSVETTGSAIKGAKALSTTEKFAKVELYQGNDFKFTLHDPKLTFSLNEKGNFYDEQTHVEQKEGKEEIGKTYSELKTKPLRVTDEYRKITIPYKDVALRNEEDKRNNLYISAIITEYDTDTVVYYGRIQQVVKSDGNLEVILPAELEKGKYKIKLFEEQYNGGSYDQTNLTDYASKPVELVFEMYRTIKYSPFNLNQQVSYNGYPHGLGQELRIISTEPELNEEVTVGYSFNKDGGDYSEWSTVEPQFVEAGEYKIKFRINHKKMQSSYSNPFEDPDMYDENSYYKSTQATLVYSVVKRPIVYAAQNVAEEKYDGEIHSVRISVQSPNDAQILYYYSKEGEISQDKIKDLPYQADNPLFTEVGEYLVYYKMVDPAGNYADTYGKQLFKIAPKDIKYIATSIEQTYDGFDHGVSLSTYNNDPPLYKADIKYKYPLNVADNTNLKDSDDYSLDESPKFSEVGEYEVGYEITAEDYQTVRGVSKIKINKATINWAAYELETTYNGNYNPINMQVNISSTVTPEVKYYWDKEHTKEIKDPKFRDVMEKTNIYYTIKAPNYEDAEGVTTAEIKPAMITYKLEDTSNIIYDGNKHGIYISTTNVDDNAAKITYSTDGKNYSLKNPQFTDAGTYTVYYRIEAKNYKTTEGHMTFTIQQRLISSVHIDDIVGRRYNGKPIEPSIIIEDGSPNIISKDDYEITYSDNTQPGTGTITITGKNNYAGKITKHFIIYSDSYSESINTVQPFATSGSSLLGVPSFGFIDAFNANTQSPAPDTTSGGEETMMVDFNGQELSQESEQEQQSEDVQQAEDVSSENSPKPKSIRDYIYIVIGIVLVMGAVSTVIVLKLRKRKKATPDTDEKINLEEIVDVS